MIGYKAFDENLQCRGFQFEVGKTYDTGIAKEDLRLCSDTVFHFCRELHRIENVSDYCISKSRVCEVIAEGDIVTDGDKYGTNKLTILREIPREELNEYNSWNSGNRNSGNRNSGDWNSGNCNSGNCNSGDWNSGNCNSGDWNSGNRNSGNWNSGNWNSGDWNSGFFNTDSPLVRIFNKKLMFRATVLIFPISCILTLLFGYRTIQQQKRKKKHIKLILKPVVDLQRQFLIKMLSVLHGIKQVRKSIKNS